MSKLHCRSNITINSFSIVAVFGNKVDCCFDEVERCFNIVAGVKGALVSLLQFDYECDRQTDRQNDTNGQNCHSVAL